MAQTCAAQAGACEFSCSWTSPFVAATHRLSFFACIEADFMTTPKQRCLQDGKPGFQRRSSAMKAGARANANRPWGRVYTDNAHHLVLGQDLCDGGGCSCWRRLITLNHHIFDHCYGLQPMGKGAGGIQPVPVQACVQQGAAADRCTGFPVPVLLLSVRCTVMAGGANKQVPVRACVRE